MPTPGLIDWSAGSQGSIDAANIEAARDRHLTEATERKDNHEQMRENTRALMQKNDDNDMTLAERAVHHAAWMKNNQDGQYEARMAKMMAIEDAKLTNEYLEADKITRANNKEKADYEQIVANQPLMDRALQTIATQKPANAIVLSGIFAQTFAGNNDPLVLDTMLKLNALSDAGMKEFDTYVNWVIDNTTDDPEVMKKSQTSIVRMADNIITQADPDLRGPLGEHFAARLHGYSQREDQRKAREYEMQIESYMAETGVSKSTAQLALKTRDILTQYELTSVSDQLEIKKMLNDVTTMQTQLDVAKLAGEQAATTPEQQAELGKMQAVARIKLEQTILETSEELNKLDLEEIARDDAPPVRKFGNLPVGEFLDSGFWDRWEFTWSKAQDNALIEADTRIAELKAKMVNASKSDIAKYSEAIHVFETMKREFSWFGGVHVIPKYLRADITAVKDNLRELMNHGSIGDYEEAAKQLQKIMQYYDSVYTPDEYSVDSLQYRREALLKQRKAAQDRVDYGNSQLIESFDNAPQPIEYEPLKD